MENERNISYGFQKIEPLDQIAKSKFGPQIFGIGSIATEFGAGISIAQGRVLLGIALVALGGLELGLAGASTEIKTINKISNEPPRQQA